jgi:UDP-N-acetylglucosamine 2-epimerase (non-hydrolysing)
VLRLMIVFGTRPEAIKMAPVVIEMRQRPEIETIVCVTGQHRGMLDEALNAFEIRPDHDLDIMKSGQTLSHTTTAVLQRLTPLINDLRPARVIVHGDTTTTLAATMAAFYEGVPVGHVEAGLRTGNLYAPWPEEFNRRVVDIVSDLLWAPTEGAAEALRGEGAALENIFVTGNTVVDALSIVKARIDRDAALRLRLAGKLPEFDSARRLVLVTGHRRENFGAGLAQMCRAVNWLAARPDTEIVWPLHPNPQVVAAVSRELQSAPNVHIIAPLDYLSFVALMMRAHIIVTDSGGIQEEAPTLGKPVLVTRDATERPEALTAGTARLVGGSAEQIVEAATGLLDDPAEYARMASVANPFGDGQAARRIADSLIERHRAEAYATARAKGAAR